LKKEINDRKEELSQAMRDSSELDSLLADLKKHIDRLKDEEKEL
jgi:hypothetical protein